MSESPRTPHSTPPTSPATPPSHSSSDIFASGPSSPSAAAPAEPSELPRVRRTHVTDGFRAGVVAGQAGGEGGAAQAGFDDGFARGARVGMVVGFVLGALREVRRLTGAGEEAERAAEELDLGRLMKGEMGRGMGEREGEGTLDVWALTELKRWLDRVQEIGKEMGLDLRYHGHGTIETAER